jgi:anoctamin-10
VHLYFEFLTTYTRSLIPLSIVSFLFWALSPTDSYPPLYAITLSLYSTIFVAYWRIKERKLAVKWGTRGCESVAVGKLRPEYVANTGLDKGTDTVDAVHGGDHVQRDVKVALSVPIIAICGVLLGSLLMGIFLLEAFVTQAYEGIGHQVLVSFL